MAGTQNISHLAPVLLFARAGIDLVMVPAKSEPQAVSDLISRQVDLYFGNSSALLPHVNNDKIRLIAVGTAQRIAAASDIPAVAETLPGFEFSSWNGFLAPAGTPEPIITTIRNEVTAFAKSPEIFERLSKLGIVPGGLPKEATEAARHSAQGRRARAATSRPGNDLTDRFSLIVEALAGLRSRSRIIDGEAVCCGDDGVPSFDRIRYRRHDASVFLCAFDLIELDGDDLRREPLDTPFGQKIEL